MTVENLTLKEKISQMFIAGFVRDKFGRDKYFKELVGSGLGGVIFFTHNIESETGFRTLINSLRDAALIPMFYSIDQEGGRVERTEKIHGGKKYLSAKPAFEMGLSYLQDQTKQIALELKSYGINMNFAPVLDVNTNKNNPIIGERAFSDKTDDVIRASKTVIKEYEKYGIITVGKHFPGHGDAGADSHKTLPVINLPLKELIEIHVKPFKEAIQNGSLSAIMAAHVLYPALEPDNIPASLSKKIITDLLINQLKFKGVIMTDDMEMNAVKGYTRFDACVKAINAGINMFIFREADKNIFELISQLENAVNQGIIDIALINASVEKILNLKYQYGIIQRSIQ